MAGLASLVFALGVLGLGLATRRPLLSLAAAAIGVSVLLGVTSAIAVGGDPLGLGERAGVRADLWTAAVDVVHESPVRGVGAGGFAGINPVSADADLRWAHQGFLQVAAEWGIVGLVLVLAVIAWAGARLWVGGDVESVAFGAAALSVVGLHATVDHIWHSPAVLIVLAALLGASRAGRRRRAGTRAPLSESGGPVTPPPRLPRPHHG